MNFRKYAMYTPMSKSKGLLVEREIARLQSMEKDKEHKVDMMAEINKTRLKIEESSGLE